MAAKSERGNEQLLEDDTQGESSSSGVAQAARNMAKPLLITVAAAVIGVVVVGALGTWAARVISPPNSVILEQVMLTNKPRLDKREYQYAKLSNGIEIVNVVDPTTKSSGFSVAVEAGSYSDPKDLQGLAHFCEHMLFLGTEKYPDSTGFDGFLNLHGGSNNAYTAEEVTVYYAQLDQAGFSEGLDRFADFFRAPLFDKKFVQKEVHAIDSEHAKNRQSPDWRVLNTMKSLANKDSPEAGFHTGNIKTLYVEPQEKGIDTVDGLRKYFNENYCAPRLRLVTFGKASAAEQLKESYDKFQDLTKPPECEPLAPKFGVPPPYGSENLAKYLHIKGTQPSSQLWMFFSFPDLVSKYKSHPLSYMRHVLGYGGENSLDYFLRETAGLTTDIDVAGDSTSAGTSFWIVASLTEKGSTQEAHKLILDSVFYYVYKMLKKGVDIPLYKSLSEVKKLGWDWSEQSDITSTVQGMSEQLTRLPKEYLLTGDYLIEEADEQLISILTALLKPGNMNVGFVDAHFDKKDDVKHLPFYGVEYTESKLQDQFPALMKWSQYLGKSIKEHIEDIEDRWVQAVQKATGDEKIGAKQAAALLRLPEAIENIPKDIKLANAKATPGVDEIAQLYGAKPHEIEKLKTKSSKQVWFREGSKAESPKVNIKFAMRTKKQDEQPTAKTALLFSLWKRLLEEELGPKSVDLRQAGISYTLDASPSELYFGFGGFKHNLESMMTMVMESFQKGVDTTSKASKARFERIVTSIKESLTDNSAMPIQKAIGDRTLLLKKGGWSEAELLEDLTKIKIEEVGPVVKEQLQSQPLQFTSLIMGNIAEKEVVTLQTDFEKELKLDFSVPLEEVEHFTPVVKPGSAIEVRKTNPRKDDGNHVTTVTLMYGVPTVKDSVIFGLIGQVMGPTAYDELRTNQQLGYVVSGGIGMISNVLQASIVVQGDAKLPDDIESQIDMVFTKLMLKKLESMTDAEFVTYKASYLKALIEPPLGFSDEIAHYWPTVARGGLCENRRLEEMDFLRHGLKDKKELLKAWESLLYQPMRPRVVVKYFSKNTFPKIPERPKFEETAKILTDLGVPTKYITLRRSEHEKATLLSDVDSKVRASVLKSGSYYPKEIMCNENTPKDETAPKPDVAPGNLLQTLEISQSGDVVRGK